MYLLLLFVFAPYIQSAFNGNLIYLPSISSYFCNDGTKSGYYWQAAQSGSNLTTRYLIFLQSGAWCWDQASCNSRWASSPSLMSSAPWSSTLSQTDGIFISNDWQNANIAYIPYCSSDGWIGNATKSSQTYGWYFNGYNIVTGVMADLLANKNLTSATQILLTGCSAGGRGMFNLVDYMTNYLRNGIPNGKQVLIKGLMDSAWWLEDMYPYQGQNPTTLVQQAEGIYSMGQTIPQQTCESIFGQNNWQCAFGANLWPLIQTDHAYNLFLLDSWQLGTISNGACCSNSPSGYQLNYVLQFLNTTRYTLFPPRNNLKNIFAPACYSHCSTISSNYFNIKINGQNLDGAISNWFFQNIGFQLIDSCTGWKCGQGCP